MKGIELQTDTVNDVLILAEKRREMVFAMVDDLKEFAMHWFGSPLQDAALDYLEPFRFDDGMELKVFGLYIWWSIFSEPVLDNRLTIFQLYDKKERFRLKNKSFLRKVLASWRLVRPSFYEVKKCYGPRAFLIEDLFDRSTKEVTVYNQIYEPAHAGDIVTGIVFPLGDGTYTSLFDFLQLPHYIVPILMKERNRQLTHEEMLALYPQVLRRIMYEMMVVEKYCLPAKNRAR